MEKKDVVLFLFVKNDNCTNYFLRNYFIEEIKHWKNAEEENFKNSLPPREKMIMDILYTSFLDIVWLVKRKPFKKLDSQCSNWSDIKKWWWLFHFYGFFYSIVKEYQLSDSISENNFLKCRWECLL